MKFVEDFFLILISWFLLKNRTFVIKNQAISTSRVDIRPIIGVNIKTLTTQPSSGEISSPVFQNKHRWMSGMSEFFWELPLLFSFLTKRWPHVSWNSIFLTIDVKYNSVSTSNLIFSRTLISLINWRFWFDCLLSQSEAPIRSFLFSDFKSVFNKILRLNFFQILFWSWI